MAEYRECPKCGRRNDPQEICVCRKPQLIGEGYVSEEEQNRPTQYELYLMEKARRREVKCC